MRMRMATSAPRFRLPVTAVKTYQVQAPLITHWRLATCAEVDCPVYLNEWRIRVEGLTPAQQHAIRTSGRRFRVLDLGEGQTWWIFEPGQRCFRAHEHRLPVGRPNLYVVRDGDPWRGNPRGTPARRHTRPEFWVEDFAEHQQMLYDQWRRG